jgi:hypothetical protein
MFRRPPSIAVEHSITDEPSALTEGAIRSQPVAAANRIQYRIHTGGNPAEIFGSIIDGDAAEGDHQVVLGLGSGAKHFQTGQRAELQGGRSYPTGAP